MSPRPEPLRQGTFSRSFCETGLGVFAALLAIVVLATSALKLARIAIENGGRAAVVTARHGPVFAFGPRVSRATATTTAEVVRTSHANQTNDEWSEKLRDPSYWAKRNGNGGQKAKAAAAPPPRDWGPRSGATRQVSPWNPFDVFTGRKPAPAKSSDDDDGDTKKGDGGNTFRTVCVRLCDGYFWPISFATTDDNFERDQKTCERSCGGQAKLYVYKNPGGELDDMEDLKGVGYKKLKTAFAFRAKYDAACKCQPHPWEEAALDRHRLYALETQKQKGNRQAAEQLVELKGKIAQAEKAEAQRLKAAELAEAKSAKSTKKGKDEKSAVPVETAAKPQPPKQGIVAAIEPSKLDPAFRAGRIKAGLGEAVVMGPPAPPQLTSKQVASVPTVTDARSDAIKGAVIMRAGIKPPVVEQRPAPKLPPIINRPAAAVVDDWRKAALKGGN